MENLLEKRDKKAKEMAKEGWVMTVTKNENMHKYVLENKDLGYRDFLWSSNGQNKEAALLNNLAIAQARGKVKK